MRAVPCDVIRFDDAARLADGAAAEVLRLAAEAIAARGRFRVALAGGSTPRDAYAALARLGSAAGADWSRFEVWFGDERVVPVDHPDSNAGMALRAWLRPAGVPARNVVRPRTELGDAAGVAAEYEAALRTAFRLDLDGVPTFDLVLLGLGADGHTASWFPGLPSLRHSGRLVAAVCAERSPSWRVTLTPRVVNAARHVRFLVRGADKAPALAALLADDGDATRTPARLVRPVAGDLAVLCDAAAAPAPVGALP